MPRSTASIKLDNPAKYLRILEGDSFRGARARLSARAGELRIEVEADDSKSLSTALNGIRKQIEIIRKAGQLLE